MKLAAKHEINVTDFFLVFIVFKFLGIFGNFVIFRLLLFLIFFGTLNNFISFFVSY